VSRYIIVHVPHSSDVIPSEDGYLMDTRPERNIVTDWYTDDLIVGDQSVIFPLSRVYCDVERFENDPLESAGQGVYYTRTLGGGALRERNDGTAGKVMALYRAHHHSLVTAIEQAILLSPVCLVDAHSYSDYQAGFTGFPDRPDICIGTDRDHTPAALVKSLVTLFTDAGYSVALDRPYAGTMIPHAFRGNPNFSALMLEINKRLYLTDGDALAIPQPSPGYAKLKDILSEAMDVIRRA
jgi:N-formylglutamate amidohydrolase